MAEVDETVCIGCGICTPTCETEAVRLIRREGVKPPPEMGEFLEARLQ
jgi:NAD-dependent dihydropyrimidine dehydrogenase PreA subunit